MYYRTSINTSGSNSSKSTNNTTGVVLVKGHTSNVEVNKMYITGYYDGHCFEDDYDDYCYDCGRYLYDGGYFCTYCRYFVCYNCSVADDLCRKCDYYEYYYYYPGIIGWT